MLIVDMGIVIQIISIIATVIAMNVDAYVSIYVLKSAGPGYQVHVLNRAC